MNILIKCRIDRTFCGTAFPITEQRFRELMAKTGDLARDIVTVLVGRDAVDCGFDRCNGGLQDALRQLNSLRETGGMLQ
jgi:hypothetical protein